MTLSLHGVFVPIPTFFKENEDLDLEALDQHIQFLANSGVSGVVVLGSMGEAVSLSDEERSKVIERVVESKNKYNPNLVIIAGTSSQSARNAIAYTKQAAAAGAQYALILPPSFYRGSITDEALIAFYTTVADQSPLPVIIYNYPGVCQGLDISVKVLAQLSKHKNIAGVKGTEGNVGKMANLAEKVNSEDIALLAGSADFFLAELLVGAVGLIPGGGNVFPSLCVELQRLYEKKEFSKAASLQRQIVEADDAACRWYGIAGVKSFIHKRFGYGNGVCRNPLLKVSDQQAAHVESVLDPIVILDQQVKATWK
ncbi:hypothetical protein G6F46_000498 [Rhizopus delemar]|uniref:Dihydrodipicolinate synthase n=3 Tax=Rhizopus TaxID=4842 RepID=I1CHC9_RHIO9|nr:hypothetical protein RO3G_12570 [Rhizopus delemar RA 99-880]KAG1460542.1 hypothetical protein G6F55_004099 [Rhizopus delemar]KAG1553387.1 hypothetical protein G6F51_000643 [Rhizopus arrhizus]KAG1498893.1 hypothetical protein G6F54_004766 [Rhizopus delemar]KAG1518961.1 hypothetical protein G6F53_000172 [Rhizopus delemar]|eukprot:EIE87859.1 hypothetical protein RO3G_12570 [Rhizopus delemar RA 99-880]